MDLTQIKVLKIYKLTGCAPITMVGVVLELNYPHIHICVDERSTVNP